MNPRRLLAFSIAIAVALFDLQVTVAEAQVSRFIDVTFTPTRRMQFAVWVEQPDGTFVQTLFLSQSVARRGIGNRPGASQFSSGLRWGYGRREQVLPIWAYRRAHAPQAKLFKRVIFQNRYSDTGEPAEGYASQKTNDSSKDDYFCIAFNNSDNQFDIDVMGCASPRKVFNSDKGRFITESDVQSNYFEPWQDITSGQGTKQPLDLYSLYPPRLDLTDMSCENCSINHKDVWTYREHALATMPELDSISRATLYHHKSATLPFTVPEGWKNGPYVLYLEAHVEADKNTCYDLPRPTLPDAPGDPNRYWDSWAISTGLPNRGQPSVVYRVPFTLGDNQTFVTRDPIYKSSWEPLSFEQDPALPIDSCISNDAAQHSGSGADRLLLQNSEWRLRLASREVNCTQIPIPPAVPSVGLQKVSDRKNAHRWATLTFKAPDTSDTPTYHYEVRFSNQPITDDNFLQATPAMDASSDTEALSLPTQMMPGQVVEVTMGGLSAQTRHYVAMRAVNTCNQPGPLVSAEYETPGIAYSTVSPCFVATASYGSALHPRVDHLRWFRNQALMTSELGRDWVRTYYTYSPYLAEAIRQRPLLRQSSRWLLEPLVDWVMWLRRTWSPSNHDSSQSTAYSLR